MPQFPTVSGSLTQQVSFATPDLGENLQLKKINSDLDFKGYNLTNLHSGFVNNEALL